MTRRIGDSKPQLPPFVDLIQLGSELYARNSCGLHVPITTMDEAEQRDAPRWLELVSPSRRNSAVPLAR